MDKNPSLLYIEYLIMPSKSKQTNNEMINFYLHKDIQKHLPKSHNQHFEDHQISLPARIGIIGHSGSKKSSALLMNFVLIPYLSLCS